MKKVVKKILIIVLLFFLIILFAFTKNYLYPKYKKAYYAKDFDIEVIKSNNDTNGNGIDDYTDILNGAKEAGKNRPNYKSVYYDGGYPPDDEGVCTDVIWRALKSAGYNLKELVDEDIQNNHEEYKRIINIDSNIDFRRVYNLHVFFKNNTLSLTTDINKIGEFQPGDILIFKNDKHIGIVSDKRNKKGIPYLIHHTGSIRNNINNLEEDILESYTIIGHYRFILKNK